MRMYVYIYGVHMLDVYVHGRDSLFELMDCSKRSGVFNLKSDEFLAPNQLRLAPKMFLIYMLACTADCSLDIHSISISFSLSL